MGKLELGSSSITVIMKRRRLAPTGCGLNIEDISCNLTVYCFLESPLGENSLKYFCLMPLSIDS